MEKQKTHPVLRTKDVFLIIAAALLLILIFQNIGAVEFKLYFWKPRISLMLVILVMAGAGFGAGYLVARRRHKSREQKASGQPPGVHPGAQTAPPGPAGSNPPLA